MLKSIHQSNPSKCGHPLVNDLVALSGKLLDPRYAMSKQMLIARNVAFSLCLVLLLRELKAMQMLVSHRPSFSFISFLPVRYAPSIHPSYAVSRNHELQSLDPPFSVHAHSRPNSRLMPRTHTSGPRIGLLAPDT